nr:MAG TPA: hypothetical protein [Caudoviricetes sp.]
MLVILYSYLGYFIYIHNMTILFYYIISLKFSHI